MPALDHVHVPRPPPGSLLVPRLSALSSLSNLPKPKLVSKRTLVNCTRRLARLDMNFSNEPVLVSAGTANGLIEAAERKLQQS